MSSQMTYKEKIEALGALGEDIVEDILKKEGFEVIRSEDKYDSEKDFLVQGCKVEVKTVVPWFTENALTIDVSQYRKCSEADYVVFVCVPSKGLSFHSNNKYDGNIYTVLPKDVEWIPKTTKNGLSKRMVRINQPGVILCHTITDQGTLNKLQELTTSTS